jgi:REP-associated tyrosine transposase
MTKGLKRYYGRGYLHFVTFSCYRRLPLLEAPPAKDLFLRELARARREYGFALAGYVVMPEHVHLLLSEPRKGTPSTVLQMLKQRVSRKLRNMRKRCPLSHAGLLFPESADSLPQFWQTRFYDFNVYTDRKRREKLDYMHRNRVSRKLVPVRKIGPGAVICTMKRVKRDGFPSIPLREFTDKPRAHPPKPRAGHPAKNYRLKR